MKNFAAKFLAVSALAATLAGALPLSFAADSKVDMDALAKPTRYDPTLFRPTPELRDHPYSVGQQLDIYGGKRKNEEPFYPILFGRRMYGTGPLGEGINIFGAKNLAFPRLMGFGDWRTAYAFNEDAVDRKGEVATRLNLDLDLQLTSTERIHAFVRPLDQKGKFTRCTFGDNAKEGCELETDFNLESLFFEGDLGNMVAGVSGRDNHLDLPFAVGLMPFILHNGIWVNDFFRGAAFAIPAMNSRAFNISNMDWTFFYGQEDVSTAIQNAAEDDEAKVYGTNLFLEAFWGSYIELGYGYTEDRTDANQEYHNVAVSHTHRFRNIVSLSERYILNFGQDPNPRNGALTADGYLVLLETSWMTSKPYTFIPYLNGWYGRNKPQGLAKDGGLLQNTGILFEGDALTNFQTLDATGQDTYGGALGVEYLFNLDQQIVIEVATVQIIGDAFQLGRTAKNDEYGVGFRYQLPLSKEFILRADGIYDWRKDQDDKYGARVELRFKF